MSANIVTDHALARRLERAEGATNRAFVDARARRAPESGATWIEHQGVLCMFDGAESPITQTFGLGMSAPPTPESLEHIEGFFAGRGAPVHHETCPLADAALLGLLPDRGYRPTEQSSVLYQPLTPATLPPAPPLATRIASREEAAAWAETSVQGWSGGAGMEEFLDFIRGFGMLIATSEGVYPFIVEEDGEAIATGALAIHEGVALLAGASTRLEWRGRGAQAALLAARLRFAHERGCDIAMMAAQPGSGSQRNAERKGFRIGYTRTKWSRM